MENIFGTISPPPGMDIGGGDPFLGLSNILSFLLRFIIILGGFITGVILLWGAFDWITSGGEKEKLTKAQQKITNAIIGFILIFVVLSVWGLIVGDLFGIIIKEEGGWRFNLPVIQ